MAIRRRVLPDVAAPIANPAQVISKLDHDSLDNGCGIVAALIVELAMTAILTDSTDIRTQKLEVILRSGQQHLSRMADAVLMILGGEGNSKCIEAIHIIHPDLYLRLFESERFQDLEPRQSLICAILDSVPSDQLSASAGRNQLLEIVQNLPVVDALVPKLNNRLRGWAWLRREPVRFKSIEKGIEPDVLRRLVEWDCLELSFDMIKLLCITLAGPEEDVSYARLATLKLSGLSSAIEEDPHAFITALLEQEGSINEDEGSLRYLLALIREDPSLQEEYFNRTVCKLDTLEGFSDNIWESALRHDRVASAASAAWEYYNHMIVRPTEKPSDSPSAAELLAINEVFAGFLTRNAVGIQTLWDEPLPELACLQSRLIVSELIDEGTLEQIFARASIMPEAIVGAIMTPERWTYLATAEFVPFDVEIIEAFGNQSVDLELAYLVKHWSEARRAVGLMRQDPYIVGGLAKRPEVPIRDIGEMWAGVVERELEGDEVVRDTLAAVCARANREGVSLPRNCLSVVSTMAGDASRSSQERMELLVQAVRLNAGWTTIASILVQLGGVYDQLATKKTLVRFPPRIVDSLLAQALSTRGFVGVPKESEQYIEMRSRPSRMV